MNTTFFIFCVVRVCVLVCVSELGQGAVSVCVYEWVSEQGVCACVSGEWMSEWAASQHRGEWVSECACVCEWGQGAVSVCVYEWVSDQGHSVCVCLVWIVIDFWYANFACPAIWANDAMPNWNLQLIILPKMCVPYKISCTLAPPII